MKGKKKNIEDNNRHDPSLKDYHREEKSMPRTEKVLRNVLDNNLEGVELEEE